MIFSQCRVSSVRGSFDCCKQKLHCCQQEHFVVLTVNINNQSFVIHLRLVCLLSLLLVFVVHPPGSVLPILLQCPTFVFPVTCFATMFTFCSIFILSQFFDLFPLGKRFSSRDPCTALFLPITFSCGVPWSLAPVTNFCTIIKV